MRSGSEGLKRVDRAGRAALVAALTVVAAATASAQSGAPGVAPVNDRPNPFRTVEGWAKLPAGRTWGSTSAVAIDKDGESVWVAERCGQNSCVGSDLDPVLLFDRTGTLVRSFGRGLINWPHGIHVDRDGNVWVVDGRDNRPVPARPAAGGAAAATPGAPAAAAPTPAPAMPERIFGHQVIKFSPTGQVLLRLGADGGGREPGFFFQPNAVITAPNGDIYVAEGHASGPTANARILKFDRTGTLLATWGRKGTGPLEFDQPHALAFDSQGRLFVADRSNNRIQILSQDGRLLDTWTQFSRVSGLWIDAHDVLYAADSESGSIAPDRPEWKRGIRIGSARTGEVTAFIPDPVETTRNTSAAEGVAVDARGTIYGAEVGPRALKRYERKP
ncbi:MAG: peptidyl-alpha-hydroxyglycine alpha-amidating lyase family protein [Gemmatimonadaceae bacterium]|nr:peptidyl-alpha-hydroxyglycine alpha-amidating lyase family protein [Gemmatimonadaceae bacterium]